MVYLRKLLELTLGPGQVSLIFFTLPMLLKKCINSFEGYYNGYRKAKIDCLSLFMCPLLAQLKIGFFSSFSAAADYSTNKQTKQALISL